MPFANLFVSTWLLCFRCAECGLTKQPFRSVSTCLTKARCTAVLGSTRAVIIVRLPHAAVFRALHVTFRMFYPWLFYRPAASSLKVTAFRSALRAVSLSVVFGVSGHITSWCFKLYIWCSLLCVWRVTDLAFFLNANRLNRHCTVG